ncbi:hypothetical protein [Texcoconibacillus texcoconensis]|uniref:VWFA domain-containing protein n=1 Tax=Texcoconibacillus texcoconensis TaxID=1095777 RepID=A0A840QC47_9BACI|nr:hypothetical protein [Texcoconibacillus texcoconensis]MBB5171900.1 hypothetical protein [Texcoconibacillus texcoconensis]
MSNSVNNQVSSFWLGEYRNWAFKDEATDDMMILAKVIRSIEKMVNSLSSDKKLHVRLASQLKAVSEWEHNKIVLPSDPLWNQADFDNFAHIVDIWTAFAVHEAGHILWSQDLTKIKHEKSHQFIITHLVEDFWIENWMTEHFPGYFAYFQQFKNHYYSKTVDLGEDPISEKINDLIYTFNKPGYEPIYKESLTSYKFVSDQWQKAKTLNQLESWDRIELGRSIFHLLFPQGLTDHEENKTKNINLYNNTDLEPTAVSNQISDVGLDMPSPFLLSGKVKEQELLQFHEQVKDGKKLMWASEQMLESWLKDEQGFGDQAKGNEEKTIIKAPDVDSEGIAFYQASYERIKPYIVKLRQKFSAANTPRFYESKKLYQGELDEEALYRSSYSTNIFKTSEERFESIQSWDIRILIDESKSMEWLYDQEKQTSTLKRFEVAMDVCLLMVESLSHLKQISVQAHTYSTAAHSATLQMNEIYTPNQKDKYRLGMIRPKGATPEFMAIKETTLSLVENRNKEAKKLIFILSDGQPDDYKYGGGKEHTEQIKDWINKWKKRGFHFAHISLGEESAAKGIYPQSISFQADYTQLIQEIYRDIIKKLKTS